MAQSAVEHRAGLQQHLNTLSSPRIQLCSEQEYGQMVDVWTDSFAAEPLNPMFKWLIADGCAGPAEIQKRFELNTRYLLDWESRWLIQSGVLLGIRDGAGSMVAAMSLVPPGVPFAPGDAATKRALGLPPAITHVFRWGLMPARKFAQLIRLEGVKKRFRTEVQPAWQILCLGVAPGHQGHGYGGALLRAVCSLADAQGVRVHLECESEWHERLYGKFGFVTKQKEVLRVRKRGQDDTTPAFLMLREPSDGTA